MPVAISHIYNANDSDKNEFGLGNGWRTNFNQRVYHWDATGSYGDYYVWEDADGTKHYFQYKSSNTYADEDGLELTLTIHGSGTSRYYLITDKYGNTSRFDNKGRLVKQENNQQTKSSITITYTTSNGWLISSITDGVGRKYEFEYDSLSLLARIICKGTDNAELSRVSYSYDLAPNLTKITHNDGLSTSYAYEVRIYQTSSAPVIANLLSSVTDVDGYVLTYNYHSTASYYEPSRVSTIKESQDSFLGGQLTFEYGQNQTTITDRYGNVQIFQFNNWGNTVAVYDDQGRAQFANYANDNPTSPNSTAPAAEGTEDDSDKKGNQLQAASKLQNTVSNLLQDSSFESSTNWIPNASSVSCAVTTETAYLGSKSLKLVRPSAGAQAGVYREAFSVLAGETYTFSAYVKTGSARAYLVLWDGSKQVSSEILPANSDWTRLEVSYTATASATIHPHLLTPDAGTIYMDCVQMEKAAAASRYSLIQNGDFRTGLFWSSAEGRVAIDNSAAPQLDSTVYQIAGSPTLAKRIYQVVNVSGDAGDVYVFGGWASANSVPLDIESSNQRDFAIIATFTYQDGTTESKIARFNPHVNNWQCSSAFIVATSPYTSLKIELAYDYNANTAQFDGIQLFKEEFGSYYSYDGNGNLLTATDVNGAETKYTYDDDNNLTKIKLPNGDETNYTYDTYHNVLTETTSTGVVYEYAYDAFGNNTTVTTTGGGITLVLSADYTDDGNRLESTTNTAGDTTYYTYDENTNVLTNVKYPVDKDQEKTEYEYDEMYRLKKIQTVLSAGNTAAVAYQYSNDLLSSIETGSTVYSFEYSPFALRKNVKIGSRTLATYIYKDINDQEARFRDAKFDDTPVTSLIGLDYGNGDKVQYTYDKQGRVTQQWYYENGSSAADTVVTYRYDNNGALASVADSKTGISTKYVYDLAGRIASVERRNGDSIILRTEQSYNNENQPIKWVTEFANGASYTNTITYNPNRTPQGMVSGVVGTGFLYDALNRVIQVNSEINVLTRTYTYRAEPNTNQVSELKYINLKGGYHFQYTYDSMGNIGSYALVCPNNKYSEATFTYTYDRLNQLTKATDGTVTYEYEYDNAGNLTKANGHTYTYSDTSWGDLLTAYDGQTISYDGIGNPTSYYNGTRWNFTWERGRQLATASSGSTNVSYTYDSDGLRTSKTVNGVVYNYYYDGSQLVRMTYGDNVLDFSYDINGVPVAMRHGYASSANYVVYYYITNLQGDVIRLVDVNGNTAAYYEYDPYGNAINASGSHATVNPLRYRGYVYDTDTGLYYLQSRYYDPKVGRFINADVYASTGQGVLGHNMFAYCNNNPVNFADPTGMFLIEITLTTVGTVVCITIVGLFCIQVGAELLADVLTWLSRQWYFAFSRITYTTVDEPESKPAEKAESQQSVAPGNNGDDDDDDDYYDDDRNFGQRQRIGKSKGNTPRNNQRQNKQFRDATKGLSPGQKRAIHNKITGRGYSYQEILEMTQHFISE